MACPNCERGKKKMGVCDVCLLVDNDSRERLVKWCEVCKANVCDNCRGSVLRRAKAATLRVLNKKK